MHEAETKLPVWKSTVRETVKRERCFEIVLSMAVLWAKGTEVLDDYGSNMIFTAKLWILRRIQTQKEKKKEITLWRFENNLSKKNK